MGNTESYDAEQDNTECNNAEPDNPVSVPTPMPMPIPMSPPYPLNPVMYAQPMPTEAGFFVPLLPPEETVLGELEDSNLNAVETGVPLKNKNDLMGNTESYDAEQDNTECNNAEPDNPVSVPTPMPMPIPMSPPYPLNPVMYAQPMPSEAVFFVPLLPPEETVLGELEDSNLNAVETDTSNPNQEGEFLASGFEDKTIRKAFIRKVFTLLTIQILITFTVVCVCTFSDTVKKMIQEHEWVHYSSYIVFGAVDAFLATFYKYIRIFPLNLLGLLMVTLSLSYMVGTLASYLDKIEVVFALGSALVISFSIVIFSAQTCVKFNVFTSILFAMFVDLLTFGFLSIINFFILNTIIIQDIRNIVYSCLGALLYAMYLLVDCELVVGRKKYRLNPEQYVLAALIIYLDIILTLISLLEKKPKKEFEGVEKCVKEMSDLESISSNDADNDSNNIKTCKPFF